MTHLLKTRGFLLTGLTLFLTAGTSEGFQKYTRWVPTRAQGVWECKYVFSSTQRIESRRIIWDSRQGSGQDFFINYYDGNRCTARCACKRHPRYDPSFTQWARPNAGTRSGFDPVSVNANDPQRYVPQVPSGPGGAQEAVLPPPPPPGL